MCAQPIALEVLPTITWTFQPVQLGLLSWTLMLTGSRYFVDRSERLQPHLPTHIHES